MTIIAKKDKPNHSCREIPVIAGSERIKNEIKINPSTRKLRFVIITNSSFVFFDNLSLKQTCLEIVKKVLKDYWDYPKIKGLFPLVE
jgi:hypothetical protein